MFKWIAIAEYEDGTRIEKEFPYLENGNYQAECDRQYSLEAMLIESREGCIYYSVSVEEE